MEAVKNLGLNFWNFILSLFKNGMQFDLSLSPGLLTAILAVCLLWIFSGFLAASFAEKLGKKPRLHLWIGFFVPYLYALILMMAWIAKSAKERKEKMKELEEEAARKAAELTAQGEPQEEAEEEKPEAPKMNKAYLDSIRLNPDGTMSGPFVLTLKDGTKLRIAKILETQMLLAIVELEENGAGEKVIRMPYMRIDSVLKD